MSRKTFVVLASALVCTTCGAATVHGQDSGDTNLLTTIGNLGVCGPIHQVVLNLAPRAGDGSFDIDSMSYEVASPETSGLLMKISNPERFVIADQIPHAVQVFELAGTTQTVVLFWPRPDDGTEAVVAATIEALTPALGEPETLDSDTLEWTTGLLTIRASPPAEDLDSSGLVVACTATEGAFFAALENAEQAGTAAEAVDTSEDDGLPPNPWLDRSIMSVLMSWGAPPDAPIVTGNNVVGLHYRDFLNEFEVPMEGWWWFVNGRAVYVASDFMPPRGSSKALSSYHSFKDFLGRSFGEPDEERLDEATGQRHVIYQTGPQRLVLTLFDPEGDPWFRVEVFDTTKLDELPSELRPNRSLPERYDPPPPDTGLTREDMGFAVGAG
ncbi:MAG TPA: hypothetical protein VLT32_22010 [Candidatus Sulfomarinibacteraceae bacterium]|nr:hypothetical protein [Candidatus Sulfomarinibacteraceae bacterium]